MRNIIWKLRYSLKAKKTLFHFLSIFLFLYIFSLPSFSSQGNYLHYIPYPLMIILTILLLVYLVLYNKHKTFFDRRFIFLPLFIIFSFISTSIFSKQFRGFLTLFLLMMSFFVIYFVFCCINNKKKIINIIILAFCCFTIYFIIHYRNDIIKWFITNNHPRLGSYFDNLNPLGEYMSLGFMLSIFMLLFEKGKKNLFYVIPIFMFLFVGILTGSRSFYILVTVSTLILVFMRFWKHKIVLLITLITVLTFFIVLINLPFMSFLKNQFINIINTIFNNGTKDGSFMTRFLLQKYALELGSKNLFIGYGYNGFAIYSASTLYSHGNFSECICNFGLFGTISFYVFILIPFIYSIKIKNKYKYLVFIISIFYLLNSVLIVFLNYKSFYLYQGLSYFIAFDNIFINKIQPTSSYIKLNYGNHLRNKIQ